MARHIVFLAWAPFFSGAERALLLTLQSLDRARYRPQVIVGTDGEMAEQLRAHDIPCEVIPLRYLDRRHPLGWGNSVRRVVDMCRRVKPAIIHANDMPSYQPGGFAGRLLGIPAITHLRFPDEDSGYRWYLKPRFARALFVSEYLRSDAIAKSPALFEGRSDVLYDGVQLPQLRTGHERLAIKQELGLPSDVPVVALTGQISEVKGIWDFVEAARLLALRDAPVHFAVLGDDLKGRGALRAAMEARVRELDLADRFHFLGFRSNAPTLIPAFDIVAVPSHVEPLGNATLEAMAAGVPVVGTRVGGIPEMVVDDGTGRLVPPRDPAALAEALESLVASPTERARLGNAGWARAQELFSLSVHARHLQDIYDDVLARR